MSTCRRTANILVWLKISLNRAFRIRHSRINPLDSHNSTSAVMKGVNLMICYELESCCYIPPSVCCWLRTAGQASAAPFLA